jgi:hypothetical protein
MTQRKLNWLLSAVAAVSIAGLGTSSFGQVRVDTAHVRDANNRVGSGGSNGGSGRGSLYGNSVTPNDIVYGNVTGGREFHGSASSDPRAFRGNVAGANMSRFIAGSSGAPTGLLSANNAQNVTKYYDPTARGVNPPPEFIQQGPNAGYVPAPPPTRASGDLRIGAVNYDDSIRAPRPGELVLPGAVSTSDPLSMITASPLYGVREWNRDDEQSFLSDNTFRSLNDQALDSQTLQQFRSELEVPALPTANLAEKARVQSGVGTLDNAGQSTENLAQPQGQPLGQPNDKPLPNGQLPGENLAASNIAGGLQTNQGTQQKFLSSPSQQSAQYQLMENQLKSFLGDQGYQARQANKEYNAAVQRQKEADAIKGAPKAAPGQGGPGAAPGGNAPQGAGPGGAAPKGDAPAPAGENAPPPALGPTLQKPAEKLKPVQIHSLAEGIKAQGLKQLLTQAEDQMRQNKWITAIETYQNAVRVAPNNPLVIIGRANAELGATYYARAEDDLRAAFLGDNKLLMGQYDLRKMIGDDRLSYLLSDLKEMNAKDPKKGTSVFLLAYIAYNTGNEQQAAGYLDLLEQREKDPTLVKTLRKFWALPGSDKNAPSGGPQTENLNK